MSKLNDWVESYPNNAIWLSLSTTAALFLTLIMVATVSPDTSYTEDMTMWDSIILLIFLGICVSGVFGIPFSCAKTLDMKNRSFVWMLIFFVFPAIGLIIILLLEDRSVSDSKDEITEIKKSLEDLKTKIDTTQCNEHAEDI